MSVFSTIGSLVSRGCQVVDLEVCHGDANERIAELIAELTQILDLQVRSESSELYLEAVLVRDLEPACSARLEATFGPPVKRFGKRVGLGADLRAIVDSRGGIRREQCLYLCRCEDGSVAFAALWPWSNGKDITLKVGVYDARLSGV